jgi:hypothetical protein
MDAFSFLLCNLYEKLNLVESSSRSLRGLSNTKQLPILLEGYSCSKMIDEVIVIFKRLGIACRSIISSLNDPSEDEHRSVSSLCIHSFFFKNVFQLYQKSLETVLRIWKLLLSSADMRRKEELMDKAISRFCNIASSGHMNEKRASLFEFLLDFKILKSVSFEHSVLLVETLTYLLKSDLSGKEILKVKLSEYCFSVLGSPIKSDTKVNGKSICYIAFSYVLWSSDVEESVLKMCNILNNFITPGDENENEEESDERISLSCLNRKTFPYFYKAVFESCITFCSRPPRALPSFLGSYEKMCVVFTELLEMGCALESHSVVLAIALKEGRRFTDEFLKQIPTLEKIFVSQSKEVVKVLIAIQKGTRKMQIICAHAKKVKNSAITTIVPLARKAMESLIYKVKVLLHGQSLQTAFSHGTLKPRAIDGTIEKEGEEENISELSEKTNSSMKKGEKRSKTKLPGKPNSKRQKSNEYSESRELEQEMLDILNDDENDGDDMTESNVEEEEDDDPLGLGISIEG